MISSKTTGTRFTRNLRQRLDAERAEVARLKTELTRVEGILDDSEAAVAKLKAKAVTNRVGALCDVVDDADVVDAVVDAVAAATGDATARWLDHRAAVQLEAYYLWLDDTGGDATTHWFAAERLVCTR